MPDLPSSLALTQVSGEITAAPHDANYTALQTATNAVITALSGGTVGQVLTATDANTIGYATPPGYEYAYAEKTSNTTSTQTTAASSTDTIATLAAVTFDGSTKVKVEAFVPEVFNSAAANYNNLLLFEDGTLRAIIGRVQNAGTTQGDACKGEFVFTPASGSRTYSLRANVQNGTGTFSAGAGTAGALVPAFIRLLKA